MSEEIRPRLLANFSRHMRIVKNRSALTIKEYQNDLTLFFRFIIALDEKIDVKSEDFEKIDAGTISESRIVSVSQNDVMEFLYYASESRGNDTKARARKLSAIRSFYRYLQNQEHIVDDNPAKTVDSPTIRPALPKFLSEEECIDLLDAVSSDNESKTRERDYAIITLFLNCGMRLSELVGISLSDMDEQLRSLRVIGKGSKERVVYLNDACRAALIPYLEVRARDDQLKDKNALFISSQHKRISNKTVQWVIYKYLDMAGLGNRKLSTHKLRHTAATLMYRTGQVDVRVLKEILGHEQLNTTQIYTHVSDESMEKAVSANPLARVKPKKKKVEQTDDE